MALGKWIGGFLGFIMTGTPLGALAGFAIGALFDAGNDPSASSTQYTGDGTYGDRYSQQQQYSDYQQRVVEGQRNSFRFSLLVVTSYIIRADGHIMHSEMNVVRQFLRQNFGEVAVHEGEQILLRLFEQEKRMGTYDYQDTIRKCCIQISQNMPYEQRLILLNYLVEIAKADGRVESVEVDALKNVSLWMRMQPSDLDSLLHLESDDLESAYRVLGLTPSATNEEVKAAYRRMALKHHPDRVATLGEDVRKAAEKKFQEINAAKERIYKARGL